MCEVQIFIQNLSSPLTQPKGVPRGHFELCESRKFSRQRDLNPRPTVYETAQGANRATSQHLPGLDTLPYN